MFNSKTVINVKFHGSSCKPSHMKSVAHCSREDEMDEPPQVPFFPCLSKTTQLRLQVLSERKYNNQMFFITMEPNRIEQKDMKIDGKFRKAFISLFRCLFVLCCMENLHKLIKL